MCAERGAHEATSGALQAYSIEAMADAIAQLLKDMGICRPHVVGYSLGARIALALALRSGVCCFFVKGLHFCMHFCVHRTVTPCLDTLNALNIRHKAGSVGYPSVVQEVLSFVPTSMREMAVGAS